MTSIMNLFTPMSHLLAFLTEEEDQSVVGDQIEAEGCFGKACRGVGGEVFKAVESSVTRTNGKVKRKWMLVMSLTMTCLPEAGGCRRVEGEICEGAEVDQTACMVGEEGLDEATTMLESLTMRRL